VIRTTDSAVCRAALHAGAVQAAGGMVTVTPVPGMPAYVGTPANGITTSNYGAWPRSFTIAAAVHAAAIPPTGGPITVRPAPGMPAYVGTPANGVTTSNYGPWSASFTVVRAEAGGAAPELATCPQNFIGQSAALSCACTAEAAGAGAVWGTGAYTTDSRICRAAVHAGIIPPTGGPVNVVPAPGLPTYQGTMANGIQTSNFGPWSGSFTFRQ
jgi:hypothetical protein